MKYKYNGYYRSSICTAYYTDNVAIMTIAQTCQHFFKNELEFKRIDNVFF